MALLSIQKSNLFATESFKQGYEFKLLRNKVGIFTEQGGTIAWLNTDNGFAVVDAQFPNSAEHVINELKKLKEQPFKYLINTHHHGDHTAGNIAFKGLAEKVVAHQNSLANQKRTAEKANNLDKQLLPDTTFGKSWKAKLGGEQLSGYYYGSGHTNGDAVYHFENANIVHVGDLVFNRKYPFIDRANGAHIGNWISVLDQINTQFDADTLFVFGHSLDPEKVVGNKQDITAFQSYLKNLLKVVSTEIKAGKTKEEILKISEIKGAPEWKGEGITRSLSAAYDELTGA